MVSASSQTSRILLEALTTCQISRAERIFSVGLTDVENLTKACDRIKSLIEKHQSSLTKNICSEWFPLQHIVFNSAHDRTTIDFKSVAYARKFARQVEDLLSVAEDRMANTVVADGSPSSIGYTLRNSWLEKDRATRTHLLPIQRPETRYTSTKNMQ